MKTIIYKSKHFIEIPLKNCPLFHLILLIKKIREPYVKALIKKSLTDATKRIDKEFKNERKTTTKGSRGR